VELEPIRRLLQLHLVKLVQLGSTVSRQREGCPSCARWAHTQQLALPRASPAQQDTHVLASLSLPLKENVLLATIALDTQPIMPLPLFPALQVPMVQPLLEQLWQSALIAQQDYTASEAPNSLDLAQWERSVLPLPLLLLLVLLETTKTRLDRPHAQPVQAPFSAQKDQRDLSPALSARLAPLHQLLPHLVWQDNTLKDLDVQHVLLATTVSLDPPILLLALQASSSAPLEDLQLQVVLTVPQESHVQLKASLQQPLPNNAAQATSAQLAASSQTPTLVLPAPTLTPTQLHLLETVSLAQQAKPAQLEPISSLTQ
jgi:hypothetical protein